MGWYDDYSDYPRYVPVAERRAQAAREVARRLKKGEQITPVRIEGRKLAATFWGIAWNDNLEGYGDFANRLPRGRTYARNGSVVHLTIEPGRIKALVSGSSVYEVQVDIAPVPKDAWQALKRRCAGQIGTLVELLQGKLSKAVMEQVTDRDAGLFPKPREITMKCSCPDYAGMCKHIAAVMYGVGHRLDSAPELLFRLRGVDHAELIEQTIPALPTPDPGSTPTLGDADLGSIFGIDLDDAPASTPTPAATPPAQPAAKTNAKALPKAAPAPTPKAKSKTKPTPAAKAAKPKAAVKVETKAKATPAPRKADPTPAASAAPAKRPRTTLPAPVEAKPAPARYGALRALIRGEARSAAPAPEAPTGPPRTPPSKPGRGRRPAGR